jgi:hypothetical protein
MFLPKVDAPLSTLFPIDYLARELDKKHIILLSSAKSYRNIDTQF